jgi:DNA-directed RNA polymerase specialized sigma subunit
MVPEREDELKLVRAIKDNDKDLWKTFVNKYSDLIFSSIRQWCQPYCRKSSYSHICPWCLSYQRTVSAYSETCEEALDMYIFSLEALKGRIVKFRGESRLSTFIVASMRYVKLDYFRQKYGRLQVPQAIKKFSKTSQEVYKLLCRGKEKEDIAGALNITSDEVREIERDIRNKLRNENMEWKHLDGWIAIKSEPQPLISEYDDDIIDQTPAYFDPSPEEQEIKLYLKEALKELSPVKRRLLQLRFQKRLSVTQVAEVVNRMDFFNITTQKQIYNEIDEAIEFIAESIKKRYDTEKSLSGEMKKCVKDLIEDLMLSTVEKIE